MTSIRPGALVAVLVAALAPLTYAQQPYVALRTTESADPALQAAAERGLLLRGLNDVENLRTVLTEMVHQEAAVRRAETAAAVEARASGARVRSGKAERPAVPQVRLPDAGRLPNVALRVPPALARDAIEASGVDAQAIADLVARVPTDLVVSRVEFLRGFDPAAVGDAMGGGAPHRDPRDPGGLDDGDFTPGLPSLESLVGSLRHHTTYSDGYGSSRVTYFFSDNSQATFQREVAVEEQGLGISTVRWSATDSEGDYHVIYESTKIETTGGQVGDQPDQNEIDDESTQAEIYVRDQLKEYQRSQSESGSGDRSGGDHSTDTAPDPEKYRPADGDGVFCPLAVEVCRRYMQEALDSRDEVLVGVVLVNPADPNVQPDAPRLVIDPQGLVINPDPNTVHANTARNPSTFRMALPVAVLPPRPGTTVE